MPWKSLIKTQGNSYQTGTWHPIYVIGQQALQEVPGQEELGCSDESKKEEGDKKLTGSADC
jgi:hypothetical protein